jgi:hypothetical protein
LVATIAISASTMITNSEPYKIAVKEVTSNPKAREVLGDNIKPGWTTNFEYDESGSSGKMSMALGVAGSKGKGTLYVDAKKDLGRWLLLRSELELDGQSNRVNLLDNTI